MDSQLRRYVPLAVWMIVAVTFLMIPMRIISYGYLPGGDARRHVAKPFTDKPYTEIVIMRPEYSMDHSPGWEKLLGVLHQSFGWGVDGLMSFSIAGLLIALFAVALPWLRRPEAWLAALLAQMVAIPELMTRFTQARPYEITEAILIAILFAWSKPGEPSRLKLALTSLGFAASAWMHGSWYLWVMPLAGFFLAGWWRHGLWLTGCWTAGSFAGALLTGHPFQFLKQALLIIHSISQEHLPQWMLVGELGPHYGEFFTLAVIALMFLWRRQQGMAAPTLLCPPLLAIIAICWILGFKADRCWADWGIPAVLVWLALQFDELMSGAWDTTSPKRVLACALLAAPLFLHSTNDLDRRYSRSLDEVMLDAKDPSLQGWLPERNGIFYSAHLGFFYSTFYKNPTADWRYVLGFEPALMKDDDLAIYRQIQRGEDIAAAYEKWIKKMRPEDRLAIYSNSQPALPQLEWHHAAGAIWIGRLPR